MIWLYTGTPGSGKSLHLARRVSNSLTIYKMPVIANFPINTNVVSRNGRKKIQEFTYLRNDELTVSWLCEYAQKHHKAGKESQTLLVIDEAGIMFNSRDYGQYDRKAWVNFFMVHRHYGFDIVLVSQFDRMVDRQIRAFVEYEVKHRKANNFGWIGFIFTLLRIPLFVAVETWYGMKEKTGSEFFRYRKRDSKLYDTMMLFGGEQHGGKIGKPESAAVVVGDTERSEEGTRAQPPPPRPDSNTPTVQQPPKRKGLFQLLPFRPRKARTLKKSS